MSIFYPERNVDERIFFEREGYVGPASENDPTFYMMYTFLEAASAAGNSATDCVVTNGLSTKRPDSEEVPTKIQIGTYVIKIFGINDIKQNFKAICF